MAALFVVSTLLAFPALAQEEAAPEPTASAAAEEGEKAAPAEHGAEAAPKKDKTALGKFNDFMLEHLFFDVFGGSVTVPEVNYKNEPVLDPKTGEQKIKTVPFPFLVMVLALGAIFFTLWYRFINLRAFKHAIDVVRGKYDDPDDEGEISHFHALTSALSATVGLGNIAGVAVAIVTGGPGAVVWMMILAVFGMTAKFSSCTLAQLYRQVNDDGSISGGPMYYLDIGLKSINPGVGKLGKVLGVIYAFMVMGGALGGGNMFQANQTVEALTTTFGMTVPGSQGEPVPNTTAAWVIGIIMAILVAAVILGGIKRIGAATSKIVPLMCAIYVIGAILVILFNIAKLPESIGLMITMAFSKSAFHGGVMGVLVTGVQRAAFSNEAGIGSASIAHAAAKTDEPVREGMVAMLGPFIDTIIVCFMTAMVVIITGEWNNEAVLTGPMQGASITAGAFATVFSWFPYVLSVSIALFAYSTMISWCYYGERGWIYLLDHFNGAGLKSVFVFRIIFVLAVIVGAVNKLGDVLTFSDIMILSMAFPNIIGSIILAPRVLKRVQDYWGRFKSGKMLTYEQRVAAKAKGEAKAEPATP
jgi:AGCS family alanine or glycine:cation symporter